MNETVEPLIARIRTNLSIVEARIARAAADAGRDPAGITLVGVTKMQPLDVIRAGITCGIADLAENYAQEFEVKYEALDAQPPPRWHFIGTLQSNKAALVTGRCALIQTIDRKKIAEVIARLAGERGIIQDVLVQAHLGEEESKSGASLAEVPKLCEIVANLPGLRLRGLMGVAPLAERDGEPAQARKYFDLLKEVFDTLHGEKCDILSMGMSGDYLDAIASGSTMVRIGSALFGARGATSTTSRISL